VDRLAAEEEDRFAGLGLDLVPPAAIPLELAPRGE
jgi:hypothetical protein